ncbi:nitroreductase family protein [Actinokineospora sp. NPDC004072]
MATAQAREPCWCSSGPGATAADRLRTGVAASAVLLAATVLGLSSCALPQPRTSEVQAAAGLAPRLVVRAGVAA